VSCFGPNPSSPKAKEELIGVVACRRALEPKDSPSRPRRLRRSLPVVALYSIEPGPPSSIELKFELDTQLTVSCVVAAASAYGLVTVSIAINSVFLAFDNAVIILLILFALFGWRELLGEFSKKGSAAK